MKPLTLTETADHMEFAWRAALVINFVFIMAFLLTYFDSDRDASDIDEFTADNGQPVSGVC